METNISKSHKHGLTNHPLYAVYYAMRARCYNPKEPSYKNYGAKGVVVCDLWLKDVWFFFDWALTAGWKPGLSIDRIDPTGNYSSDNCRWATQKQQCRNRRNSIYVEWNGERLLLIELCEKYGFKYNTLKNRLNSKWTLKDAIEKPVFPVGIRYAATNKPINEMWAHAW